MLFLAPTYAVGTPSCLCFRGITQLYSQLFVIDLTGRNIMQMFWKAETGL